MSNRPAKSRSVLTAAAGASLIALTLSGCFPDTRDRPPPPPPPPSPTVEGFKNVIENLSLEPLGPAGEGVQVLMNADEITKAALIVWLRKKEADAASAMDEHRQMWYRANLDCLAQGDCLDLRKMQNDREKAKTKTKTSLRPPTPMIAPLAGGEGNSGGHDGGHGGM